MVGLDGLFDFRLIGGIGEGLLGLKAAEGGNLGIEALDGGGLAGAGLHGEIPGDSRAEDGQGEKGGEDGILLEPVHGRGMGVLSGRRRAKL